MLLNGGTKTVTGKTKEGARFSINWQSVPGFKQPLLSLGKLAGNQHRIILDDDLPGGGVAIHKPTGKQIGLHKTNTYEVDLLIDLPTPAASTFQRPA